MGEFKAFDWVKAAELIKEHKALKARVGLVGGGSYIYRNYIGGTIYDEGPVTDGDHCTASIWATPILVLLLPARNMIVMQCYKVVDDHHDLKVFLEHAKTVWPEEALEILK